jgi:pseudouridine synthase
MPQERLQKFIASTGLISRRNAEVLMTTGRVKVNGVIIKKLGSTVDPDHDEVMVDDEVIEPVREFSYIALNKPTGYVCSRAKHKGERTVYDLVPDARELVIAGRLDKDSQGLVILSNDGELTNKLTHPRYRHEKEYEIATVKPLTPEAIEELRRGIRLDEGKAIFDQFTELRPSVYRVVLHQGWKRQIRRMIGAVHNDVVRLTRVRINKLELGDLQPAAWKKIRRRDIV